MKTFLRFAMAAGAALALSPAAAGLLPARVVLPAPDVAAVLTADALKPKPQPYRFAVPVVTHLSPLTHGVWTTRPDGLLQWQLAVAIPGAQHLNLGFTRFGLPEGAALTVTAADGSGLRGPYGPRSSGRLWTPVVRGAEAVVTLTLPAAARPALDLALTHVNFGFRAFGAKDEAAAKSGACENDVACPVGDEWRDEIRSVARISIGGAFLCTGTMLNNTAQDFAPYFLTATHCVTTPADGPGVVVYWNYETSSCGGRPDGQLAQTQSGSTYVAGSGLSDFTLLLLDARPDPAFNVYYAGWDARDLAPLGVVGIHHPAGDEKRISFSHAQTEITGTAVLLWDEQDSPGTQINPGFLKVPVWHDGVTEQGSSGSAIWNLEHRVVGQLSGGSSACQETRENNGADWYGRFHMNMFGYASPLTSAATHLDAAGTGAEFVEGADPNGGGKTLASGSGVLSGGGVPLQALVVLMFGAALRRTRGRLR